MTEEEKDDVFINLKLNDVTVWHAAGYEARYDRATGRWLRRDFRTVDGKEIASEEYEIPSLIGGEG